MNRDQFLTALRAALAGLPAQEIEDIVIDYTAYFAEAQAAGRPEHDVAAALGDPRRLGKELRAEIGLKRWEAERTPANLAGAMLALFGLAAFDLIVLLPMLCVLGLVVFVLAVVLLALIVAGVGLLASPVWYGAFDGWAATASVGLTGAGLVAGGLGCAALLMLALEAVMGLLGRYVRLHHRLARPVGSAG